MPLIQLSEVSHAFGHVPLLFDPVFAGHLQEYGKGGLKAHRL